MFKKLIMATLGSVLLVCLPSMAFASDDYAGDGFVPQSGCPNPEPPTYQPSLRQGHYGLNVEFMQSLVGAHPDGCFGEQTVRKVRQFQEDAGLHVDGIVGGCTWRALNGETVGSGCLASRHTASTSSQVGSDSELETRIVIDQWREVVRLEVGGVAIDTMPMIDNHIQLGKGQYTVCGFTRTNYDASLAWKLPNFVRLCQSDGTRTGMGFHAIPVSTRTGQVMHDDSYLGTGKKMSGGCVRLSRSDSEVLWDFAVAGMTVQVV